MFQHRPPYGDPVAAVHLNHRPEDFLRLRVKDRRLAARAAQRRRLQKGGGSGRRAVARARGEHAWRRPCYRSGALLDPYAVKELPAIVNTGGPWVEHLRTAVLKLPHLRCLVVFQHDLIAEREIE